jgi:hypothetical protein
LYAVAVHVTVAGTELV